MIGLFVAAALAQAQTPSPAPIAAAPDAKDTYEKKCLFCHGADGRGKTKKGRKLKAPDFTSAKWQTSTADEEIEDAITNGVPKTKMPAFKAKLSPDEIMALGKYIRAFGEAK